LTQEEVFVAKVTSSAVVKSLQLMLNVGPVAGLSDAQLLDRFMGDDRESAEVAFAAIVDRHGPMVCQVCRQMLVDAHDAQDVFQATFFILSQQARSVRQRESLASWLHGVAYRVCLRTRLAADRRRLRERTAAILTSAATPAINPVQSSELGELIHAELARLPERYRAPIVLCDLQDVAYEEAARILGCPVGTVKSRLARGREQLRARLVRRGLAPLAGPLVMGAARATIPVTLKHATARAALRFTMHGSPNVGTVSTTTTFLTEGIFKSMALFKLRIAAAVLALAGLGTAGMVAIADSVPGEQPTSAPRQIADDMRSPAPIVAQSITVRSVPDRFPEGPISRIEIEGSDKKTVDKIRPKLLSRVGQALDQTNVEGDLKTLLDTTWFSNVSYYLDESPPRNGKWALVFVVREMPLLTKVELRGRKAISLNEIEDITGVKAGRHADPRRTKLAVAQISRLYLEKGYDLASVRLLEGGNPGDTQVVIEIFEGPKVTVRSIRFAGNHFATNAQLRTKIATRSPIQWRSGLQHGDAHDDDRRKLIEYYRSQGFFDAKITLAVRPGARAGEVDLTFVVSEGMRYKVRNVIIQGNTKLESEKLKEGLELHSLRPFVNALKEGDKNRMLLKYGEIGHIDAQIAVEPSFTDQPGVVDLVYTIEEHGPFMSSEHRIQSNARTKDMLIHCEPAKSGVFVDEMLDNNRL
jgi:RNA polymerase sigma factor (sigma-70 family)